MGQQKTNWYKDYEKLSDDQKRVYRDQLVQWIVGTLAAVPPGERDALAQAAKVRARRAGDLPYAAPFAAIPPGVSDEVAAGIKTGAESMLQASLGMTPDNTVGQMIQAANNIVTGVPAGGDPTEQPLLPSAAAVLLESGLKHGSPDLQDPAVIEALVAIDRTYDCAQHVLPLGGGLFDSVKSWFKGNFGSAADKAAYQQERQGKLEAQNREQAELQRQQSITKLVKGGMSLAEATQLVDAQADATTGAPVDQGQITQTLANVAQTVGSAGDQLSSAVSSARSAMDQAAQKLQAQKDTAKSASLQLARLQWAQAALNASDEVAQLLAEAKPDFGSAGGSLQTAVDILTTAKDSDKVPTVKLFSKIIGSLRKRNNGESSWIESLLGGDPTQFYSRIVNKDDSRVAQGLEDFLKEKAAVEDLFSHAPADLKKEVAEL